MFVTEPLIYLQLQKTACTHIARLLNTYLGGEQIGKHRRMPRQYLNSSQVILGSVRNPWDWYVSLWAFGCSGQGDLRRRLGEREIWPHVKNLPRHPTGALKNLRGELTKPIQQWADLYSDARDPQKFRQWLHLLFNPQRQYDLREGYAHSAIAPFAGLMTYRYLRLHCLDITPLYQPHIQTWSHLYDFDQAQNMLTAVIRMEHLSEDFITILAQVGYPLTPIQAAEVRSSHKSNPSKHRHFRDYYDEAAIALVADREQLIIEKYNYRFAPSSLM